MPLIDGVESKLEAKAASFVKENRLPGAAVGIVVGDDLVWSAGVGYADILARRSPDVDTSYRIASITKTFTATAIMQLRDKGRLRLDDPAVAHVPELRLATSAYGDIEAVTIRRMLSHESGLMSEPPETDWRVAQYEGRIERNLKRAPEIGTKVPPNTQLKYSNLAYQLLGEIVSRVSGETYVDYVRQQILEPLGMTKSAFEPVPAKMRPRRATGYAARYLSDELEVSPEAPTIWAEGGMWSCVEDLARWIAIQFHEASHAPGRSQILAPSTLKEMHQARYLGDKDWTQAWCIGWFAIRRGETIWIQHSGSLPGFRSNICFHPEDGVGAIALINGVGDASTLAMDLATTVRDAIAASAPRIDLPKPLPEAFRELLGLYEARDTGTVIRVEWRDGRLSLVDPALAAWRPTLLPTDQPDVFLIEPGVRQSGEYAVFRRLPDGRVASILVAVATYRRLDPVGGVEAVPS